MFKIVILTKILESLKKHILERENRDSNIFIFYNNKIDLQEAFIEKLFKQINHLKLFLLILLNLFIFILLIVQITKITKEKHDSLISILILIALVFSLPIFIMMMRIFNSTRIKRNFCFIFYLE